MWRRWCRIDGVEKVVWWKLWSCVKVDKVCEISDVEECVDLCGGV